MKNIIFTVIAIFLVYVAHCQSFQKQANETADGFVKRIFNVQELFHPVIETKEWDSVKKVILCFIPSKITITSEHESEDEAITVGYVLIPENANVYRSVLIDTFSDNYGGRHKIETVFFANTDKDKNREIGIIVSFDSRHKAIQLYGTYYETKFYDNPDLIKPTKRLKYFEELSDKFYCFEGDSQGKSSTCKYKDVATIRSTLKSMGY